MSESAVLAIGRIPLCGFIQIGNTRAVSVSILAQFLELSDKYTRMCLQFSDWVEISFDPLHFPVYAQVFNEMRAHIFHRFNFLMRPEELPRETIPEKIPDTTGSSVNDESDRLKEASLKFARAAHEISCLRSENAVLRRQLSNIARRRVVDDTEKAAEEGAEEEEGEDAEEIAGEATGEPPQGIPEGAARGAL
jgi:hypothetical protein